MFIVATSLFTQCKISEVKLSSLSVFYVIDSQQAGIFSSTYIVKKLQKLGKQLDDFDKTPITMNIKHLRQEIRLYHHFVVCEVLWSLSQLQKSSQRKALSWSLSIFSKVLMCSKILNAFKEDSIHIQRF